MIISLSKDKTALVGIKQGKFDEDSTEFALANNQVFLKDKSKKIKFEVSATIRRAIENKGYFILCQSKPFEFFKVRMIVSE